MKNAKIIIITINFLKDDEKEDNFMNNVTFWMLSSLTVFAEKYVFIYAY